MAERRLPESPRPEARRPESPPPEVSRPVEVARLGLGETRRSITAEAAERAALAARFGLLALDRLTAEVRLEPLGGGLIRLSADFTADVVQSCVVTLEPVPARIEESFTLLFGAVAPAPEIMLDGEGEVVEPILDGVIDLGEAVAQQLSLALDPFPRAPKAALPEAGPEAGEEPAPGRPSPFAGLEKWRKSGRSDA